MTAPPKKPAGSKQASNQGTFKKGQSGNPAGRPKGAKGVKTLLAKEFKASININENGKKKRVRRDEALVKGLMNDALRGRDRPRETVLRYADAIDRDSQQRATAELAIEDQAILDRYVERRMREMKISKGSDIDDE